MLLVYQAGSVKVGEVVRYTLTYTPADDRIIPSPSHLHVRIKNTSAIALRAAYLHGPYTIHCSAYPSTFNPNQKLENPKRDGIPQFEPNLKAGGHWYARLAIPDDVRHSGDSDESPSSGSVTWIVEVASQILFSGTATVHYEILVGRDERSLDLGFAAVAGKGHGEPGQLQDHVRDHDASVHLRHHRRQSKGVYSSAVKLVVEDTNILWDKPHLPSRKPLIEQVQHPHAEKQVHDQGETKKQKRKQKVHLVVLTHGLHSNIGADMLYLKESIDATVKRAREEEREKRRQSKMQKSGDGPNATRGVDGNDSTSEKKTDDKEPTSTAPLSGGQEDLDDSEQDLDEEQVVVRGFSGNTVRTEKGIQYLGKRLAKFVLTTTYPDQPYLPQSKSLARQVTESLSLGSKEDSQPGDPAHPNSTVLKTSPPEVNLPYTFTSISFVGHSLGGLIQMYAIAYIQKHSPEFFQQIKPVNFIAMASPFLGLSNENPMYVKFALDFGLVGRTGQDLGLTWRPPTVARNGWNALLSGLGSGNHENELKSDPRAKPLLRILPTGPAHKVLKMFRNRTVYSNVVNDGVVPLRTSCLLFLDWRGLGRVENAQRDNGLLATLANFGWNELTGANSNVNTTSHKPVSNRFDDGQTSEDDSDESSSEKIRNARLQAQVDAEVSASPLGVPTTYKPTRESSTPSENQWLDQSHRHDRDDKPTSSKQTTQETGPLAEFLNFFRPSSRGSSPGKTERVSRKTQKTFHRAQTIMHDSSNREEHSAPPASDSAVRPSATRGDSMLTDVSAGGPPPKTSIFEAAGDIINPPLPTESWLIDPSSRSRTIFHDRIYHPDDIPPPQPRRSRNGRSLSADGNSDRSKTFPSLSVSPSRNKVRSRDGTSISSEMSDGDGTSGMRVEEKIAREYHRDLSWRKVLVRLEPDAHNNMIVRRMFANAYGWDVVKHLCDTHFANTYSAETADEDEPNTERVPAGAGKGGEEKHPPTATGEEVIGQTETRKEHKARTTSEAAEGTDEVAELKKPPILQNTSSVGLTPGHAIQKSETVGVGARELAAAHRGHSIDSSVWDDRVFDGTDVSDDDDDESDSTAPSAAPSGPFAQIQRFLQSHGLNSAPAEVKKSQQQQQQPLPPAVRPDQRRVSRGKNAKPPTDAEIADALTRDSVDAAGDGEGEAGILEQIDRQLSRHDSFKGSHAGGK